MLISKLEEYQKAGPHGKGLREIISTEYRNLEHRKYHEFYGDEINGPTLMRTLSFLIMIFRVQLLVWKNVYFPWIGLFRITPEEYFSKYTDYRIVFWDDIKIPAWISKKIDLHFIENIPIIAKNVTRERLLHTFEGKITNINNRLTEKLWIGELKIVLDKPKKTSTMKLWGKGKSFKDIVDEYNEHPADSLKGYMSNIEFDKVAINPKIVEDVFLLIGYIEAEANRSSLSY